MLRRVRGGVGGSAVPGLASGGPAGCPARVVPGPRVRGAGPRVVPGAGARVAPGEEKPAGTAQPVGYGSGAFVPMAPIGCPLKAML